VHGSKRPRHKHWGLCDEQGKAAKSAYEELGFRDAEEMLLKAQLAMKIAETLRKRGWNQQQAAKVLGMTQPKLSGMLRGQFRGISEVKMMECLVRLGRGVKIVVGPEGKRAAGAWKWWRRKARVAFVLNFSAAKPQISSESAPVTPSSFTILPTSCEWLR